MKLPFFTLPVLAPVQIFPILGLFLVLALPGIAAAQYPPMEEMDPFARPVLSRETVYEFPLNSPDDLRQWGPLARTQLAVTQEGLAVEATGPDPYFVTGPLMEILNVSPEQLTGSLEISFRMKATQTTDSSLYWSESDHPDFSERLHADFIVTQPDQWQDISIRIETDSPLTRLRFDPDSDRGEFLLSHIAIHRLNHAPFCLKPARWDGATLLLDVTSTSNQDQTLDLTTLTKKEETPEQTQTLSAGGTVTFRWTFPKEKPFESVSLRLTARETQQSCQRDFSIFHEDVTTDWISIHQGETTVEFAPDGSGAIIQIQDKTVAALYPLIGSAGRDNLLLGLESAPQPVPPDLVVTEGNVTAMNDRAVQVTLNARIDETDQTIPIQFSLDKNILNFSLASSAELYGPVVHVFGNMEQAVFPGVEYLEKGENSSSTADLEIPAHLRAVAPRSWITIPFQSVITDRGGVTLFYNEPMLRPIFASPNFIDGKFEEHRLGLFGGHESGSLRVTRPEPIETAILWAVERHGLPDLPLNRPLMDQNDLTMKAFEQSDIKAPDGWRHAAMKPDNKFSPLYGSDFVSTIYEITGQYPEIPRLDRGGGHIANNTAWFVSGQKEQLIAQLDAEAASIRAAIRDDGSFGYQGKFLQGHWSDTASGHCANFLYKLLLHWQMTGNDESLSVALRGLDYVNQLKTPRGAQVWELSLHTPDIMGSSRCCLANILAWEATGHDSYLTAARRWAITGLPFVYLWKGPWLKETSDIMPYATIAVFGATDWESPNWMGRPVQWCGLDYAHALFLLAPHDKTLDWHKIAEGIVRCGQLQQYPDGSSIGLLPDSYDPQLQRRLGPDINPSALHYLRSRFMDKTEPIPSREEYRKQ